MPSKKEQTLEEILDAADLESQSASQLYALAVSKPLAVLLPAMEDLRVISQKMNPSISFATAATKFVASFDANMARDPLFLTVKQALEDAVAGQPAASNTAANKPAT